MKKSLLILILCCVCMLASCGEKTVEKNYGLANVVLNVTGDSFDASKVVPAREDLIAALKEAGYTVTESEIPLDAKDPACRVYAEKGN